VGDVRLIRSWAKNFMSIRSAELNFENRGLVLVEGPNGVGKSAFLVEPLCYALFGVSERYGKSRDLIVNRFVGKDCNAGALFLVDGVPVEVSAFRKDSHHKDNVYLTINGVDKRGNNNDQTWEKVGKLLDMDYTSFTNSVVFGQALSQYFSSLSDSAQKEIVERLLGITWIPEAYEIAKKDRASCLDLLTSAERDCEIKVEKLDGLKQELKEYQKRYDEFEDEKRLRIKELEESFKDLKDTSNIEKKVRSLESRKLSVEEDLKGVSIELRNVDKDLASVDAEVALRQRERSKISKRLETVVSVEIGSICEFCGSKVSKETVFSYAGHLKEDSSKLSQEIVQFEEKRTELDHSRERLLKIENGYENRLETYEKDLKLWKKSLDDTKIENARAVEQNASVSGKIEDLKSSINAYLELVEKVSKEISSSEFALKEVEAKFITLKSEMDYHRFWEEGYSNRGLKSFIIESVIPQMNQFARLYSSSLGGKFDISFSAQKALKKGEMREKFYVDVVNKFGSQCYEGNSNGERRAIDSIVMFTLGDLAASRSNKRFSVLILDDVFEKLSEEICESIIRVLKTMVSTNTEGLPRRESVFVLTHLEYFKEKFESRITVKRDHNGNTTYDEV